MMFKSDKISFTLLCKFLGPSFSLVLFDSLNALCLLAKQRCVSINSKDEAGVCARSNVISAVCQVQTRGRGVGLRRRQLTGQG